MTPKKPFSIEQSEELIAQLKTESTTEFEQLRKTLQLLGQVPELSQGMVPPVLPSNINQTVVDFTRKTSKSHRTILTSLIAAGIIASATLTAAAVTGRGPAPIVAAAHHTAKFMKDIVGTVTHAVSGGNSNPAPESNNQDEQSAVASPTTSSSGDNNDGNSSAGKNSSGDNNDGNSFTGPKTSGDNNTEKNGTQNNSEGSESKSGQSTPRPSSGENGNGKQKPTGEKHSETAKPEVTPTPAGEVVPQRDVPTTAPEISQPASVSDTDGSN